MQSTRATLCEKCRCVADRPRMRNVEPRFRRSDYVPSETERSQLEDLLKEGEKDIKQMEEDISVLRRKLDHLERAKNATEATTSQYRAALSAHRRIPMEIWGMIFSELCLSLHDYSFDISYHSPLLGLPAIVISQVCSHWNVVSKGMPSLWSKIEVGLDESRHYAPILLDTYLKRSEGFPLTVRIESVIENPEDSFISLAMWKTLSKHLHRCRVLVMAVMCYSFNENLPPIQSLTFPNLETYEEENLVPRDDTWPWFWEAIYRTAPKLRVVSSSSPHCYIPFSQLTALEIPELEFPEDLDVIYDNLECCRSLNSLTLSWLSSKPYDLSQFDKKVELPFLRRLHVHRSRDKHGWLSNILGNLVMHSLETCCIGTSEWPLSPGLITMVERSSTSLKRVVLTSNLLREESFCEDPDPLLFDFLQAAPELTHFELSVRSGKDGGSLRYPTFFDGVVSTLLSKLTDNHQSSFLPKLESFTLAIPNITLNQQIVEHVLEIVTARRPALYPLTQFRLRRVPTVGRKFEKKFFVERELLEKIRFLKENRIEVFVGDECENEWTFLQ